MPIEIAPHMKIVQHPNSSIRTFHLSVEIAPIGTWRDYGERAYSSDRGRVPTATKTLVDVLLRIPGVTTVAVKQYELNVTLSPAFAWAAVGPMVLGAIVKAFYPELENGTIEISAQIGLRCSRTGTYEDDDAWEYLDTVEWETVPVSLGSGRPLLDVEHFFGREAITTARVRNYSAGIRSAAPVPETRYYPSEEDERPRTGWLKRLLPFLA